jgi:ABC-type nitrate/sulfonate/bicarbonate transport system permease component
VVVGFTIAILVGIPLGILLGSSVLIDRVLSPVLTFLRQIPGLAWIPFAVLWFGIGHGAAIFIVFMAAVYPIFLNAYTGRRTLNTTYLHAALTLGAKPRTFFLFRHVILPGVKPYAVAGIRIGLGYAWMAIVAAELVGARGGLGYFIEFSRRLFDAPGIVAGMVVIATLGVVLDRIASWMGGVGAEWQKRMREEMRDNGGTIDRRMQAAIGTAVLLLSVAVWQVSLIAFRVDPARFPSPVNVASALLQTVGVPEFLRHIGASLARVLLGFLAANALAIPLGTIAGWFPSLETFLGPLIAVRNIPPVAWIPLAILWFGIGDASAVFIIMLSSFFPSFLNAIKGVRDVNPVLIQAALTMGVRYRSWSLFREVVWPSALSTIMAGLRISLGYSWTAIVAAEMIATTRGLGYMLMWYAQRLETGAVVLAILGIGAIGLMLDATIRSIVGFRRGAPAYILSSEQTVKNREKSFRGSGGARE